MNGREAFRSRSFARDRRTWIATLVAALALWAGTTAWLNRRVALCDRRLAGPTDDGRFVVLAYDRIVAAPDGRNLDRVRLREELRAIAAAGWQAITLGELRDAYRGTARLPAKPLLLTFDEGYLGTYESVDPVLRELRWPAVMLLRTERQEARDVSFLFWDRLQRMTQSGLWEIASGDPAGEVPAAPAKEVPAQPPGVELIARRMGAAEVAAWGPRGADPLVALSCVAGGMSAGRNGAAIPWLGFVDDVVGANAPGGSPFRIARLRVDPRWTTPALIGRMGFAVADPAEVPAAAWVAGEGTTDAGGGVARLEGHPRAELWVPAARWVDDWSLELRVRVASGEFWIVQPAEVPGREWRVGGTLGGLYVEDRTQGRPPDVLGRAPFHGSAGLPHRVRVVKRGAGVAVAWDDRPLTPLPVALPERWRGKVGVIAYRAEGGASLTVDGIAFRALPYRVRAVSASPRAEEVAALTREAEAIAGLSPAWATLEGGAVRETPFDRDLFRILARRYAWDIVPAIAWKGGALSSPAASWIASLPERVSREGWDGLRIDRSGAPREAAAEWDAAFHQLDLELHREQKRLVVAAP